VVVHHATTMKPTVGVACLHKCLFRSPLFLSPPDSTVLTFARRAPH
jgi:hypothetical protein